MSSASGGRCQGRRGAMAAPGKGRTEQREKGEGLVKTTMVLPLVFVRLASILRNPPENVRTIPSEERNKY